MAKATSLQMGKTKRPTKAVKAVSAASVPAPIQDAAVVHAPFDPYGILLAPLSTEKSIRQIEFENKIVFVVSPHATKSEVKKAVQGLFKVKVVKVNIQNSFTGQKRAYVRLSPAHPASDVSADLGLI